MTTDNEALKLANSVPELQSLLYDVDLMPEQLDPTGFGYRRMLAIVEAYKVGIQTGRDQMQKELAEMERQVKDLNKCSYMGAMRDCPTHGESEQLKLLKQENQILIEELKEARAENSRFGMGA